MEEQSILSNKDLIEKYADIPSYEAFKNIISDSYKNTYAAEHSLNKSNIENLQKYYKLSAHHLLSGAQSKSSKAAADSFSKEYVKTMKERYSAKNKETIRAYFKEEAECLNKLLAGCQKKHEEDTDSISAELEELYQEKIFLQEQNKTLVNSLSMKVKNKSENKKILVQRSKSSHLLSDVGGKESRDVQLEYLEKVILRLEKVQAAESLKCIVDTRKCIEGIDSGEYEFCVLFDQAISNETIWITEANLKELNQAREHSLWKIYDIPQKTRRSIYAPNVMGLQYCETVVANKKVQQQPLDRHQDWEGLMKHKMNVVLSEALKNKMMTKLEEGLGFCHHCRHLFPDEILIKCNYRSSSMGFPYVDEESSKRKKLAKEKLQETFQQIEVGDKRNRYLFYQRENGELLCERRFCQHCLKQTYGLTSEDFMNNPEFVCPFCKEDCICSRCNRNEHIDKLRTLFVTLGGEIENINYKSYLEKFLLQRDEIFEETIKKKYAKVAKTLKAASGIPNAPLDIKSRVEKYKNDVQVFKALKDLRVNMEKARMICAQVNRREMLKAQIDLLHNEIFSGHRNELIDLAGQKRKQSLNKDDSIEPVKTKILKTPTKVVKLQKQKEQSESDTEESSEEEEKVPVIKKRGRPPKKNTATSNDNLPVAVNKNKVKEILKEELKKKVENKLGKKKEQGLIIKEADDEKPAVVKKSPGRPRKIDQAEKILGTVVKQQLAKKKLDVLLKFRAKNMINDEKLLTNRKIKTSQKPKYKEESSEESGSSSSEESEFEEEEEDLRRKPKVQKNAGRKISKGVKSRSSTSSSKEIKRKIKRN